MSLKDTYAGFINKVLKSRGYEIKSVRPIDLRDRASDPRLLHYCGGRNILINVPLNSGRIDFLPLTVDENPFVRAVAEAAKASESLKALESPDSRVSTRRGRYQKGNAVL